MAMAAVVKGLVAVAIAASGAAKVAGVAMLVENFDKIGLSQGFRYVMGATELIGVILMLVPATTLYGALVLGAVCVGAFLAEAGPLHGDVVHVTVLAVLVGLAVWCARAGNNSFSPA